MVLVQEDRKQYGVKRQWHLMPFRQLLQARPESGLVGVIADYQDSPSVHTARGLYMFCITEATQYMGLERFELEEMVVDVLQHGNTKYGPGNWKNATSKEEYLSAYCRHMFTKEDVDKESGLLHVAHGACNALFLMWMEENLQERPKSLYPGCEI